MPDKISDEVATLFMEANATAFASIAQILDEHIHRIEGLERQMAATLPLLEKLLKALGDEDA